MYKCENCIAAYGERHTNTHTEPHSPRILPLCCTHCKVPYTLYSRWFFAAQSVFSSNSSSWDVELVVWLTLLLNALYSMRSIKIKQYFLFFGLLFGSGSFLCVCLFFRPFIIIQKRMKMRAVSDLYCKDAADDDDDDVINSIFICRYFSGQCKENERDRCLIPLTIFFSWI